MADLRLALEHYATMASRKGGLRELEQYLETVMSREIEARTRHAVAQREQELRAELDRLRNTHVWLPPPSSPVDWTLASSTYYQAAPPRMMGAYGGESEPVDPPEPELPTRKTTEPVLAWRGWKVVGEANDLKLASMTVKSAWEGPVLHSPTPPNNAQPVDRTGDNGVRGSHGIYGLKHSKQLLEQVSYADVWGEVLLYGKVVVHEKGYRAEHAMIQRLLVFPQVVLKYDDIETQLTKRYGCEVTTDVRVLRGTHAAR